MHIYKQIIDTVPNIFYQIYLQDPMVTMPGGKAEASGLRLRLNNFEDNNNRYFQLYENIMRLFGKYKN